MSSINMRNLIITSADAQIEDFLVNQWLKSLIENVDLSNIEVVVLDYGISKTVKDKLVKQNVAIVACENNGHVVNLRLRDTATFLARSRVKYDQVMLIDGGDTIFQSDISKLFRKDNQDIFIATQNMKISRHYIYTHSSFTSEIGDLMYKFTLGKPVLNFGLVIGPVAKVVDLCKQANDLIVDKSKFLVDQMAVNYLLHRSGYLELDKKYNFMKLFHDMKVTNNSGVLCFSGGEVIPIVHNNGGKDWIRPYRNFGYGKDKNQINLVSYIATSLLVKLRRALGGILTF